MLELTEVLADLLPQEPGVLALAALVRYAEARRPARLDTNGMMVPLSEQDPRLWRRPLIEVADQYLHRAHAAGPATARTLQAAIHGLWCARHSLREPAPWPGVLALYDQLLEHRDDSIVRLNRAVALAEVSGPEVALGEVRAMNEAALGGFLPCQALKADLLWRTGDKEGARTCYDAALALHPASAERLWLENRRARS